MDVSIATSVVATDRLFQILIFPHNTMLSVIYIKHFFRLSFFQNFSVTRRLRKDQGKGKTLVAKQEVRTLKRDTDRGIFLKPKSRTYKIVFFFRVLNIKIGDVFLAIK